MTPRPSVTIFSSPANMNYEVDMGGCQKRYSVFRVNILKKWHETMKRKKMMRWKDDVEETQPVINEELTPRQKQKLQRLLHEHANTLRDAPGQTRLAEHRINVGQRQPVCLTLYRLPHAYRDSVIEELRDMKESGVIESSSSE